MIDDSNEGACATINHGSTGKSDTGALDCPGCNRFFVRSI
jgi:hypothetical protein